MRIVIVGGHLAPALALIQELRRRGGFLIFWIGRKTAMEGKDVLSLEYLVIPKLRIPFFSLTTGRLQRRITRHTISALLKVPIGFLQALLILAKIRPAVLVSFGGYLSLPVVISGWFLRIPVVLHEQTTTSGLANRIASRFAWRVAISHPTSAPDFPAEKIVLTGNPVRREFFQKRKKTRNEKPILFITAGSLGSQIINKAVEEILPTLILNMQVIHQTGQLDYEVFKRLKEKLPKNHAQNYKVFANLLPDDVAQILTQASLVVSRAGANTVCEIAAVGVPAILIPIPWVEKNEQDKNAKLLYQTGLARILPQVQLSGQRLFVEIDSLLKNPPQELAKRKARRLVRRDAPARLADLVTQVARK